jgi:hypothetical protein
MRSEPRAHHGPTPTNEAVSVAYSIDPLGLFFFEKVSDIDLNYEVYTPDSAAMVPRYEQLSDQRELCRPSLCYHATFPEDYLANRPGIR